MDADTLNRTAKLLIDRDGKTIDAAYEELGALILQIDLGEEWPLMSRGSAALLTAVNTAARAFLGGVHVRLAEDRLLTSGWGSGLMLSEAITYFGGTPCETLSNEHGTIAFGCTNNSTGRTVIHCTWSGWSGGVVDDSSKRLDERYGNTLSATLAGAIAVSECFQSAFNNPVAGRRDTGLSLWQPHAPWRDLDSLGPSLQYLPDALWLAGLGHLGQAYAWVLGLLNYPNGHGARVVLQDTDLISEANLSTSLLARRDDLGLLKSRVVARELERRGFSISIVERLFDSDTKRQPTEPGLVLSGFDNYQARRALGTAGFELIVDAGLGSSYDRYLNILTHSFLRTFDGYSIYQDSDDQEPPLLAHGYEAEFAQQVVQGAREADARCGIIELAGKAVGASFVGAVAATLVLAESIRVLHGGPAFNVVGADLGFLDATTSSEAKSRAMPRIGYISLQ